MGYVLLAHINTSVHVVLQIIHYFAETKVRSTGVGQPTSLHSLTVTGCGPVVDSPNCCQEKNLSIIHSTKCFDTAGWVAGRASGL